MKKPEIIVYEMKYDKHKVEQSALSCIPFDKRYFQMYMEIYNACFYDMRKALEIEPYNFLNDYKQIENKTKDIYLYIENDEMIGAASCYGNEVDDLIVNKKFQNKGYGKQLLLWTMNTIRQRSSEPILLHVAQWNQKAFMMYQKNGFEITNVEKVR